MLTDKRVTYITHINGPYQTRNKTPVSATCGRRGNFVVSLCKVCATRTTLLTTYRRRSYTKFAWRHSKYMQYLMIHNKFNTCNIMIRTTILDVVCRLLRVRWGGGFVFSRLLLSADLK